MPEPALSDQPLSDDPRRRRAALRAFMDARRLKPYPWSTRAGVSDGTLRAFLTGKTDSLSQRTLEKLAAAEGVPVSELTGESALGLAESEAVFVPGPRRDNYLAAVLGALHPDRPRCVVLHCTGTSMDLRGYRPGDHLVVDPEATPAPGDAVIVQIRETTGGRTLFREYRPPWLIAQSSTPERHLPEAVPAAGDLSGVYGVVVDRFTGRKPAAS